MRSKGNLSKIILKRSSEPKDSWQYHKGSMRTKTSLEKVVKSQKQGFFYRWKHLITYGEIRISLITKSKLKPQFRNILDLSNTQQWKKYDNDNKS